MNRKWVGYIVAALILVSSCALEPPDEGPSEDLEPPFVTSISPAGFEDSVSVVPTISVSFSEAVQSSTAEYAFSLSDGSVQVNGICSWSNHTMIFEPERELEEFTTYYVELQGSHVIDTFWNIMGSNFRSSFTTGADNNPPHIVEVSPTHQSIDISRGVAVEVEFSESMDTTSVEQAFTLSDNVSPQAGTFSWSGNTMFFSPIDKLSDLTTYNINVTTSATDDSGNPITQGLNSSFTVGMVIDIAAGNRHTLAVLSGGTVKAWGQNIFGQLGNNTSSYRNTPVSVSGASGGTAVAAGRDHSAALLGDGSICAWGCNYDGQLGNSSNSASDTPVPVNGISGVVAIAAGVSGNYLSGGNHTIALLSNHTVMAWGDNAYGQLGNGTTADSTIPVSVTGITNVAAVAAGGFHSVALLSDGTVMTWGRNSSGQLGDGTNTDRNTPVVVSGIDNAVAVAAGGTHTLAVLDDGTVMAWGEDFNGQLGDGFNNNSKNSPVSVDDIADAVAVAAGANHSAAVLANGTIKAWGSNSHGQIGSGGFADSYSIPVTVSGITTATKVDAGKYHSAALLSDGTVKAWGTNAYGELGDGSYDSSNKPVSVSGL